MQTSRGASHLGEARQTHWFHLGRRAFWPDRPFYLGVLLAVVAKGGNAALQAKVDAEAEASRSLADFNSFAKQGLLKGLEAPTKENRTRVLTDGNWSYYKKAQILKDNVYLRTFGVNVVSVSGMVDDLTKMSNSGRPLWETLSTRSMLLQETKDNGEHLVPGDDRAALVTGLLDRLTPEQRKDMDSSSVSSGLDGDSTMRIAGLPNDQRRTLLNFALSTGDTAAVQKVLGYSNQGGYVISEDTLNIADFVDEYRKSGEDIGRALAGSLKQHPELRSVGLRAIVSMAREANEWGIETLSGYFSLERLQSLQTFLETDRAAAAALSPDDRQVVENAIGKLQWWSQKPTD